MANNNKHTGPNVPALRFPEFSGEWENKCLGDISENISSGRTKSTTKEGKYVLIGSTGVIGNTSDADYSGNLILVARVGANAGLINYYSGDCGITDNTLIIKPFEQEKSFCHYVYHYLKHYNLNQFVFGSGQPLITGGMLKRLPIRYGTTDEINKVSSLFDLLDARIEAQSKIIEEQETLLKSLADILFRQNNHLCPLSELVDIIKGKQLNADNLSEEGDFYVMNGGITPSGYYSEYNVSAGAISISEGGNSCGYVQFNEEPFWSGGHCYSLRSKNTIVDYKYIYYFLKAKQTDVMALRIGSGLPNIQKKDIEKFTISFPSVQLQKQIVKALDALSEKINTEKQFLEKYCQQKNYLLSKLFI